MKYRLIALTWALAALVAMTGCGTNTYGVAQKSTKELKYVSDADLCYSQRYWRSPQMMSEISRRGLHCGVVVAAAGNISDPSIVGFIPTNDIGWGVGCTQYLKPIRSQNDYPNRIIFHWGYPVLDRPNGKCISSCQPTMQILGKNVAVQPLTPWPEELIGNMKQGGTFTESYQYGSTTIQFDNTITFACPSTEGECEVTKFDGVLTVSDSGKQKTYQTMGECGL